MSSHIKIISIINLEKLENIHFENPILIPKPKILKIGKTNCGYKLSSKSKIYFSHVKNQKIILEDINNFLADKTNISLAQTEDVDDFAQYQDQISLREFSEKDNEDSYILEINKNVVMIYGLHEKGLFYGIQTLIQLIKNDLVDNYKLVTPSKEKRNEILLPGLTIIDEPDLKIRGIAQDISRGQVFTLENAKRYIRIISHYKMNFYCPYMEDMFMHPKHPLIGKNRGALTIEEIKEIDAFAKTRFVEFVPIFECLGHMDSILQHKEYEQLAEFPGAHSLSISNPKIFDFLNDYISEISRAFSTKYFHIGCDESFDIGRYHSRDYIKSNGKSEALLEFYEKVYQIACENNNEHVIMYDDIVRKNEKILKNLNKNLILMYWDYSPKKNYPDLERFLNAGFKVIVSPSMLNWQRNFPDNKTATRNIHYFIKEAYNNRKKGCLGVINSTWGDMRYYSFRENEIFGAIESGDLAWNCLDFNYHSFIKKFGFLFYGIEKKSLDKFKIMFSKLSKSSSYYYRLSFLLPPLFFTYFFKHPFPKKKFNNPFENYEKLGDLAANCLEIYDKLKSKVLFESENFEYIEFGAELAIYLREKIDISLKVSNALNQSDIKQNQIDELIPSLKYIKEKTIYLKNKFESLWLRAAKRPCLDLILELFDFLIEKYEEKITQLKNKIYFKDPYIESEWIWSKEKFSTLKPRYFRKVFEIKKPVKKAILQGIAFNHMKVYINKEFVGEVLGRYTMSILPIKFRVKTFDITEYLKQGINTISIEAYNYDQYKGAINLFGQILLNNDKIQEIKTDKNWICKVSNGLEKNTWTNLDFNEENWDKPYSYGRPPKLNGDIFKPNLLKGEKSNTQDYFGIEGYMSNFTDEYDGKKLEQMIKIFNPYGN
ncbi:MAG: family 20 glycosylhydrolase [Candidatus Hermodarchaeota archaeon]